MISTKWLNLALKCLKLVKSLMTLMLYIPRGDYDHCQLARCLPVVPYSKERRQLKFKTKDRKKSYLQSKFKPGLNFISECWPLFRPNS